MLGRIKYPFRVFDFWLVPQYSDHEKLGLLFEGFCVFSPQWIQTDQVEFPSKPWKKVFSLRWNPGCNYNYEVACVFDSSTEQCIINDVVDAVNNLSKKYE